MQAFPEFAHMPTSFWALVKFVSETLGYTLRKQNLVRAYSYEEIYDLLEDHGIPADEDTVNAVHDYCCMRAEILNEYVRDMLMDAEIARHYFEELYDLHRDQGYLCKCPMNKQSGTMKKVNYFTAMVNIIAERTIRESASYVDTGELAFDDDPRGLVYVFDDDNYIIGASSRRFDGAYPNIINPKMVWEIKEYYYATTFGSRVADGVYETQLDGYEFRDIARRSRKPIMHVFFIDAYKTWWEDGKSYLCRIVDILNSGLVDEVIVGREVFDRWPEVLNSVIE